METGTSSRPPSEPSYEVFLNFRGADTRHTFTDFLYRNMVGAGIIVFRDNESLHIGEKIGGELLQAIENSQIYIPIFSENYASSCWCLRELAHMVDWASKSNGNKEILPIFLGVEPADVKLKTNLYTRDFAKRQRTSSSSEEESWKKALIDVSTRKGWTWKKDESQVKLIQSIVQTVVAKLNVRSKLLVSEHLVGVDDQVQNIIEKLDVGSDGVRFLGIHGMGGIGKTTLAKVVFNQLSSDFKDCHFLLDVGESSRRHRMKDLQEQLLSKFSPISVQIDNEDDGINEIKRVLFNKKVLIVLDDVDEKKQLKCLAGKGSWFGSGSRIIITTRDQSVLTTEEEVTDKGSVEKPTNVLTHEVLEMEFDHALKLFSRHAFRRDYPQDPYVSLSEKVVSKLGKLPLALEIIGSSLSNKSEAFWVETLEKLKKAPPGDVRSKLMIPYERLDPSQKQVFLDIACFFVGEDKTYPCYMWDACGYYPHNALEALSLKSLIKIKDNNTFWMHDQVRDLGRDIVLGENFEDPYERSRVWNREEGLHILKRKEGNQRIKALSLPGGCEFITLKLADLPKLRFFRASGFCVVGDFNNPYSNLTWLSCRHCLLHFGPNNICPPNLVVLEVSYGLLSKEGIGWIKEAKKLKVLILRSCGLCKRTPDLSKLASLEILDLGCNDNLVEIDPSICELKHLTTLNLGGCPCIKDLPDCVWDLESLIELDLSRTRISHLSDSIGNLKQLTVLRMSEMWEITKLPSTIWLLEKLEVLDAHGCEKLIGDCPEDIERLSCLRILDLSRTKISGLPTTVSRLSNLQELKLDQCSELRHLPELPSSLTHLVASVTALPTSITTLTQLEYLCSCAMHVPFLPRLPSSLRKLQLKSVVSTQSPDFSNLKNLLTLNFLHCSMPEFSGIFDAELEELEMCGCNFMSMDALFKLEMKRLTSLSLHECEFRPEIVDLSHMKNLQQVCLVECKLLLEIRCPEELGSLSSLTVEHCSSIERMPDLSKLRKLRELMVNQCPKLRSVEGLNHLESLELLWIGKCESLESLADTSNLDSLLCLKIVGCRQLPYRPNYCKIEDCDCPYL